MIKFFTDLYDTVMVALEANWLIVAIVAVGLLVLTIIFFVTTLVRGAKLRKQKRAAAWNEKNRAQDENEAEIAKLHQAVADFKQENENLVHERKVFFEKQRQYIEKISELEAAIDTTKNENEKLRLRTGEAEASLELSERQKEAMVAAAKTAESVRLANESEKNLLLEENCRLKAEIDKLQSAPPASAPKATTGAAKKTTAKPKAKPEGKAAQEGATPTKKTTAKAKSVAESETAAAAAPESAEAHKDSEEESVGSNGVKYIVKFDRPKNSWVIKKSGVDRVTRRVDTKEEAMKIARELVKKDDAVLTVHKKDGKFQKQ